MQTLDGLKLVKYLKLEKIIAYLFEAVPLCRGPQLQMGKKYLDLYNLNENRCSSSISNDYLYRWLLTLRGFMIPFVCRGCIPLRRFMLFRWFTGDDSFGLGLQVVYKAQGFHDSFVSRWCITLMGFMILLVFRWCITLKGFMILLVFRWCITFRGFMILLVHRWCITLRGFMILLVHRWCITLRGFMILLVYM